jgi:hypothetical protein
VVIPYTVHSAIYAAPPPSELPEREWERNKTVLRSKEEYMN